MMRATMSAIGMTSEPPAWPVVPSPSWPLGAGGWTPGLPSVANRSGIRTVSRAGWPVHDADPSVYDEPIRLFTMVRGLHARLGRLVCRELAVDRVGRQQARQTMAIGAGLSLLRRCARRLPPQLKHEALCFFEPLELFRQRQARHAQELRTFVSVPARFPRVHVRVLTHQRPLVQGGWLQAFRCPGDRGGDPQLVRAR